MESSAATVASIPSDPDRLFRQDRAILWNMIRATFARWPDRVIAAAILLAALAALHGWCVRQPSTVAAWAAVAAGAMAGISAGRLVVSRLAYHAYDGLLAADALRSPIRRRYRMAWHGIGVTSLAPVTLIARPSLLLVAVPAYLIGAALADATSGIALPWRIGGWARPGWTLRSWAHRPVAGVSTAVAVLILSVAGRTFDPHAQLAVVGIATLLTGLLLTGVDDAVVRFMTLTGHGSGPIIARHARSLGSFVAVAGPGGWWIVGPMAAGVVGFVGGTILLLLALRILAYRLHARRFADIVVSVLAGVLLLIAYALPVALPIALPAIVWRLHRRARTMTWLLA